MSVMIWRSLLHKKSPSGLLQRVFAASFAHHPLQDSFIIASFSVFVKQNTTPLLSFSKAKAFDVEPYVSAPKTQRISGGLNSLGLPRPPLTIMVVLPIRYLPLE